VFGVFARRISSLAFLALYKRHMMNKIRTIPAVRRLVSDSAEINISLLKSENVFRIQTCLWLNENFETKQVP
jgi:hypothetical protein